MTNRIRWLVWSIALALVAGAAYIGAPKVQTFLAPPSPPVGAHWGTILAQVRDLERRIGFRPTENFARVATDLTSYPFCGRASNRRLPYSYEDRSIEWPQIEREEACKDVGIDIDVYFDKVEAWGEIRTPITAAMIAGNLDRFVYLVIHEDCHDQYELPYGIEEPLCDVITHRAMRQFARERYRWHDVERRAINRYARNEPKSTRIVLQHYRRLEQLYASYERGEITHEAVLAAREQIFRDAENALEIASGQLNSIVFANYMTYSRHYPALASVAARWGEDLRGVVAFFRLVDARKPDRESVAKQLGIEDEKDAAFLQAYEASVLATARSMAGIDMTRAR